MNGTGESLLKGLRRLMWATVIVYLALIGVGTWAWVQARDQRTEIERIARDTKGALCTLRADLERRVEASQRFLEDNPDGIPGITPEQIEESIENQEQTVLALASLNCPEEVTP